MADLDHFAYGWITPTIAYVMSFLGCLLGFLISRKARSHTGAERTRLLIYASVAFGATGTWLMHMIALLGFVVAPTNVRYDPVALLASFAIATLDIGIALFVGGSGRRRWWRLGLAGMIMALGTAATQYVVLGAIRVNATTSYDPTRFAVSIAMAVAVAAAALWCCTSQVRHLRISVIVAAIMAAALTTMHYVGALALRVDFSRPDPASVTGLSTMMLLAPVVLIGFTAIVMLAFFSVGNASKHEFHVMYDANADELDPAVVAEISSRIALGAAAARPEPTTSSEPPAARPIVRPRPTPGTMPTWQSMPVWGEPEANAEVAGSARAANARPQRRRRSGAAPTSSPTGGSGTYPADIDASVVSTSTTMYASAAVRAGAARGFSTGAARGFSAGAARGRRDRDAPPYGSPTHDSSAHDSSAHGSPAPGSPAEGSPNHDAPGHGSPAHGSPAHDRVAHEHATMVLAPGEQPSRYPPGYQPPTGTAAPDPGRPTRSRNQGRH